MTLGDLIAQLAELPPEAIVNLGRPRSYRGYYDQLAFARMPGATAAQMLKEAEACVAATFEGYKGGDYVMDLETNCWLAEWGEGGTPLKRSDLFPAPKPGDEFTEAWVKRGESLRAIAPEARTIAQTEELESLEARAKSLQQPPESEVAAAYLKAQQQRDCDEAREWALKLAERIGREAARFAIEAAAAALRG